MKKPKDIGVLHIITEDQPGVMAHIELAGLAITGGADTIQFRDKAKPTAELAGIAEAIRALCQSAGVVFIVNDRVDVAMAVDADGVHLGQNDLPIKAARELLGPDKIIGGSASTLEQARQVEHDGADYVGFGHVFETTSKIKSAPPVGTDLLKRVCSEIRIPVVAVGGIQTQNLDSVLSTGPHGIAVISAVSHSEDPSRATAQIKELLPTVSRRRA